MQLTPALTFFKEPSEICCQSEMLSQPLYNSKRKSCMGTNKNSVRDGFLGELPLVLNSLVNLTNHPAKLGESIKFGILVYFHLYFTILRVPESSNETGPLIWSLKGAQGLQKQPQVLKFTFFSIFPSKFPTLTNFWVES